ncbi:NAD-dependent succinate-semialdehyde dehydrogenase [Marinobacterium rhizophilum]|uniref:NAD-dependent succinate-semialdehyde dehydrogenase n=1 Tax=Marinobacterium rhizophilum TaxID=420402 RepID=A0ABY5HJD3_9GAMM|nr:NAD-dependent succinate-semialdehyde dehydrogenase [Marinobacterium rhizophilum]UTW11966.1 NAD-dependent succinate-semialdehyde dehydrogenase [Marinobacterium rhizophilum]
MMQTHKMYISGEWVESSNKATQEIINPSNEKCIGLLAIATPEDMERALSSATQGLKDWAAVPAWDKGVILKKAARLMRERSKEICQLMTLEHGKTLSESEVEVIRAADFIEWGGEEARRVASRQFPARDPNAKVTIEYGPVGVVAAFSPWNYPVLQASKKLAALLAAGCSCVLKPAEETPMSTIEFIKCLIDAGLPGNVVNVVFGVPGDISSFLIRDPRIAKVTFTGSVPVGKLLATEAGKYMKPTSMELGGHSPVIIYDDVDLNRVVDILVTRKFANSAQVCVSPNRFFVHENIVEKFTEIFCQRAAEINVGDGRDPLVKMGPLANLRRLEAIQGLVDDAVERGAKIKIGGCRIDKTGYYFPPTVLTDVHPKSDLLTVEPFGPVVPIIPFEKDEDVLKLANNTVYGLAAYIFTNNEKRQRYLADNLQVGTIGINDIPAHTAEIPLGGWKESGIGVEGGVEMTQAYLKSQFRYTWNS